jgi:hypothetical protein
MLPLPLLVLLAAGDPAVVAHVCASHPADVVVDVDARELHLCRAGKADATYRVNLGGGGFDKRVQGDRKTPLGRYRLDAPRASNSGFTWFVPIGYPTAVQKANGYTGDSVGIHGPPDWLPEAVIALAFEHPWTDGCVMVQKTEEIEAIRTWLRKHKPGFIELVRSPTAVPSSQIFAAP